VLGRIIFRPECLLLRGWYISMMVEMELSIAGLILKEETKSLEL
jgi:hypothetical protein